MQDRASENGQVGLIDLDSCVEGRVEALRGNEIFKEGVRSRQGRILGQNIGESLHLGRRGGAEGVEGKGCRDGSRRTRQAEYLGSRGWNVFPELGSQDGAGDGF